MHHVSPHDGETCCGTRENRAVGGESFGLHEAASGLDEFDFLDGVRCLVVCAEVVDDRLDARTAGVGIHRFLTDERTDFTLADKSEVLAKVLASLRRRKAVVDVGHRELFAGVDPPSREESDDALVLVESPADGRTARVIESGREERDSVLVQILFELHGIRGVARLIGIAPEGPLIRSDREAAEGGALRRREGGDKTGESVIESLRTRFTPQDGLLGEDELSGSEGAGGDESFSFARDVDETDGRVGGSSEGCRGGS
jgi:hypothetical protein